MMEAKDTRMDELRLWSILEDEKEKRHRSIILVLKQVRDEQAEISFKAGRDSFLDDVGNATIPLSEVYEKGHKAGMKEALETVVATRQYDEGERAGRKEVVEILRKIGWDRPADDVVLYLGGIDEKV